MFRSIADLSFWAIGAALLTVLGAALYKGLQLHLDGFPVDSVSSSVMAFKIMRLHHYAIYGAVAGFGFGALTRVVYLFSSRKEARLKAAGSDDFMTCSFPIFKLGMRGGPPV